jgi:sugar lactone lactonase YvrE
MLKSVKNPESLKIVATNKCTDLTGSINLNNIMNTKYITQNRLLQNRLLGGAACAGAVLLMASGAAAQNLFISNYGAQNIYEYTPGGAQSTFASGMNYPLGLAFNSAGDLFVANSANNAIPASGNITEITPGGTQSIFASGVDPQGIAFNSTGNLFQSDYRSGNIYEYTPGGVQSTFATGLSFPLQMTFNSAGDLFVGAGYGSGNGYIEEITPNGISSIFASGLYFPNGLAFNSAGNLFESDLGTGNIYEFTPGGARTTFASVASPNSLAFNNAGNLFVANAAGSIIEITPGGTESTFATDSSGPTGLAFQPVPEPTTLALGAIGMAALLARRRK